MILRFMGGFNLLSRPTTVYLIGKNMCLTASFVRGFFQCCMNKYNAIFLVNHFEVVTYFNLPNYLCAV